MIGSNTRMVIAFTGKKGVGKDTAAKFVLEQCGFRRRGYRITSFASHLKQALNVIFDWDDSYWLSSRKEIIDPRWGISPRQAAQHIGTDWAQFALAESFPLFKTTTGRFLWVRRTVAEHDNILVSDLRFLHEAAAVRERNGVIIKIERRSIKNGHDATGDHLSETEVDEIIPDYTILNNNSLLNFYVSLSSVVQRLQKERNVK
jgi:hypothetical protein